MKSPFSIVKDFEDAVAEYCGSPYVVAVNSCTNALFLCIEYYQRELWDHSWRHEINIPKRTYVSVAQQIQHAGLKVTFRDEDWEGIYQLEPLNVWDAAKRFTYSMWMDSHYYIQKCSGPLFMCTSHHWQKTLGIQQGGCILHNDAKADIWFRKARFDGRTEGIAPKDDNVQIGWHMYMSPEVAAEGLVRLHHLPKNNPDQPMDDYPDLSQIDIFK